LVARLIAGEKREKQAPARKTRPRPSNLLEPNTCVRKAQRVSDAAAFVQASFSFIITIEESNLD